MWWLWWACKGAMLSVIDSTYVVYILSITLNIAPLHPPLTTTTTTLQHLTYQETVIHSKTIPHSCTGVSAALALDYVTVRLGGLLI